MRVIQSIALAVSAGISSAISGQESGVPTLSPTFRPTAEAALLRGASAAPPSPADGYPAGVSDAPTRKPFAGAGSGMTVGLPSLSPTRSPVDVSRRLLFSGTPAPTVRPTADGTPAPVSIRLPTPAPNATGTPAPNATGTPAPNAPGTPAPNANGTPAPSTDGGRRRLEGSFPLTAEAGRRRLAESIPPTLSPTFSPPSRAGRRLLDASDSEDSSVDSSDVSSDESSEEFVENDCTTGVEMKNRWNVPWCWKVKNEFACDRSYATVPKDRSVGKAREPGMAYLTGCRWFSHKITFDGKTGQNVCVPDMSCIMEKKWSELANEKVTLPPKAFDASFRANHQNNTSVRYTVDELNDMEPEVLWVNDNDNQANGNSGSDSPPEVEPIDSLNAVTEAPTRMPSALPTTLPTAIPTLLPSAIPTLLPTLCPTAMPTLSPTTVAPTGAPFTRRVASPRCGKLKLVNKKKASITKVDAVSAAVCSNKCSRKCSGCESFDSWSFKSGSKASCTCYGADSKLKFNESGAFFGAVDLETVPQCGSLKCGKKGKSVSIGKVISPRVCQWRCGGNDGAQAYERFNFKFDKDGKMGSCDCVSGKAKKKITQTFGSTN